MSDRPYNEQQVFEVEMAANLSPDTVMRWTR